MSMSERAERDTAPPPGSLERLAERDERNAHAGSTTPNSQRWLIAAGLLGVSVVLAGCGALSPGEGLPESEAIAETYDSLDTYNATYTSEFMDENGTRTVTGRVVIDTDTGHQYQVIRPTDRPGRQLLVSNGSVVWTYNESRNRVVRREAVEGQLDSQRRQIRQLVNRIHADGDDPVSTLPLVPAAPGRVSAGNDIEVETTASYEGTETIAGRDAYVISVESTNETGTVGNWTYYLDAEWFVVLGTETNVSVDGERVRSSFRIQNITFNSDPPPGRFEFTPPANATVVEGYGIGLDRESYDSRTALAAAVNFSVPDPDTPPGFVLTRATHVTFNDTQQATLQYASDITTLAVTKQTTTFNESTERDGESVTVGAQTGRYTEGPRQNTLQWNCNGNGYFVAGPLSREELVAIASSIACA
jgi:outer membrane lipoprotein-sorting protein